MKKIQECGESLEELELSDFLLEPRYFEWEFSDTRVVKLRSGVVRRLKKAKEILRQTSGCEGWNFKIWDGFRTLRTQKLLYDNYLRDLERKHPDWSDKQLDKAVRIFVSYPSRDPDLPPPHNTGGAVDLTLVAMDGEEIPMGTEFDEFNVRAFTDHFVDGDDDISEIDEIDVPYSVDQCKLFHENRTLLKEILAKVGFVNYREEWWHFSYGDREWARQTGENFAVYGGMGEARVLFGK